LLKVRFEFRSARRQFKKEDVATYTAVSGNHNPMHLDDDFTRGAGFTQGRVVDSMLAASGIPLPRPHRRPLRTHPFPLC
jgi:acyl dehydratase